MVEKICKFSKAHRVTFYKYNYKLTAFDHASLSLSPLWSFLSRSPSSSCVIFEFHVQLKFAG